MSEKWEIIKLNNKIRFKCNYCEDEDSTFRVRENCDINIPLNIIQYNEFINLILSHLICNKCNKNLEEFIDITDSFLEYSGETFQSEVKKYVG